MLEIKNLKTAVEDKQFVNGLNLKINKGEVHAIIGKWLWKKYFILCSIR